MPYLHVVSNTIMLLNCAASRVRGAVSGRLTFDRDLVVAGAGVGEEVDLDGHFSDRLLVKVTALDWRRETRSRSPDWRRETRSRSLF